jgi:hypothetical protein
VTRNCRGRVGTSFLRRRHDWRELNWERLCVSGKKPGPRFALVLFQKQEGRELTSENQS